MEEVSVQLHGNPNVVHAGVSCVLLCIHQYMKNSFDKQNNYRYWV